ncbi:response regulator transcription factor [Clostridium sp. Cult1]|uniref:response regulator transcription factor n=1 Tax=Clostridium sp. Cult1 TaxID=2079002 RepID=UPI001F01E7AE|nr:response regulator [Clostridium sp. Cult1]MCF6462605.1 response regulator [Clostridium sp. Cult1]
MKMLIVDDSRFTQLTTSKLLETYIEDLDIAFAKDGEEGFNKYKELKPDYVFVDLLMPNISGQELIRLIKDYDKNSKIFVISADIQKNVREEIESLGIIEFINKPFTGEKAKSVAELIRGDTHE